MEFAVATFNLKDFFLPRTEAHEPLGRTKLENVAALLREANAHVLLLQEVGEEEGLRQLLPRIGWENPSLLIGRPDHRGIRCAIVSLFPFERADAVEARSLAFPKFNVEDAEPFADVIPMRRPLLRAEVRIGSERVTFLTGHFKSQLPAPLKEAGNAKLLLTPMDWADAMVRSLVQRIAEARKLRALIEEASSISSWVVAGGDFNDVPSSVPIAVLLSGAPEARMVDLAAAHCPHAHSVLHRGAPARIDYVLASPALAARAIEVRVLNETLRDHGPHDPSAPPQPDSDHAPIVARFS